MSYIMKCCDIIKRLYLEQICAFVMYDVRDVADSYCDCILSNAYYCILINVIAYYPTRSAPMAACITPVLRQEAQKIVTHECFIKH